MIKKNGVKAKREKIKFNDKRDKNFISRLLFKLYNINFRFIRTFILKLFYRYVGHHSEFYSITLRKLMLHYHDVDIGMYTYGGCFVPGQFPRGIKIGRYCSIHKTSLVLNVNHPMDLLSSHPFFYNRNLGYSDSELAQHTKITIGNDVWIGANAMILPSCSSIGDGAIIGAGAIVTKNVPPYAIVVGIPAKIMRFRFSEKNRKRIIASKWWKKPIDELLQDFGDYQVPFELKKSESLIPKNKVLIFHR